MKLCIGNLVKWNSVKWNETRRIGAIFASFWVARVCQRQLGFLVCICDEREWCTDYGTPNWVLVYFNSVIKRVKQCCCTLILLPKSTFNANLATTNRFYTNDDWQRGRFENFESDHQYESNLESDVRFESNHEASQIPNAEGVQISVPLVTRNKIWRKNLKQKPVSSESGLSAQSSEGASELWRKRCAVSNIVKQRNASPWVAGTPGSHSEFIILSHTEGVQEIDWRLLSANNACLVDEYVT